MLRGFDPPRSEAAMPASSARPTLRRLALIGLAIVGIPVALAPATGAAQGFTLDDVMSAPFPDGLVAARDVDLVARYSGIRFAVLMPGVASVPAEFIERLKADVATVERLIRRHADKDVALNLVAGAARFPADGQTLSALAAVADRSLQRNRGQNERGRAAAGAPALVHG